MITHIFKDGTQSKIINRAVPVEMVERVKEIANREPVDTKTEWRKKWEQRKKE